MRMPTSKQPYCFEVNDGLLFAFAGLWDGWKDATGKWGKNVLDSGQDSQLTDRDRSRPDASDPSS